MQKMATKNLISITLLSMLMAACSFMVDENVNIDEEMDAGFDLMDRDGGTDEEADLDAGMGEEEIVLIEVDDFETSLQDGFAVNQSAILPGSFQAYASYQDDDGDTHILALDGFELVDLGVWPNLGGKTLLRDLTDDIELGPYAELGDCRTAGLCFMSAFLRVTESQLIVGYTVADANFNGEILNFDFDNGSIGELNRYRSPGNYAADIQLGQEGEADVLFINSNGFRGSSENIALYALNLDNDAAVYIVDYPVVAIGTGLLSAGQHVAYAGYYGAGNRLSSFAPSDLRSYMLAEHDVDTVDFPTNLISDVIAVETASLDGRDETILKTSTDFISADALFVASVNNENDTPTIEQIWPEENLRCGSIGQAFRVDGVGIGVEVNDCGDVPHQMILLQSN